MWIIILIKTSEWLLSKSSRDSSLWICKAITAMIISDFNSKEYPKTMKKFKTLLKVCNITGRRPSSSKNFNLTFYKKLLLNPNLTHKQKYIFNNFPSNNSKLKYTVDLTFSSFHSNLSTNPNKTKEIGSMILKYLNILK